MGKAARNRAIRREGVEEFLAQGAAGVRLEKMRSPRSIARKIRRQRRKGLWRP